MSTTAQPRVGTEAVRETAFEALRLGLNVLPPSPDGTKRPHCDGTDPETGNPTWKHRHAEVATEADLSRWYGPRSPLRHGLGIVCGAVSNGIEALDFDDRNIYEKFKGLAADFGLTDLVELLESGYCEDTPKGGVHWPYYCRGFEPKTQKLAMRPAPTEANPHRLDTLLEAKGEGGFLILAPTMGRVHPSGKPYVRRRGSLATIATLNEADRDALWDLAQSLDERPHEAPKPAEAPRPKPKDRSSGVVKPGEDFNARASWDDVLDGWTKLFTRGTTTYWKRPGKDERGWSATTGRTRADRLNVYSSSTPFEPVTGGTRRTYDKFSAYAVLHHKGDLSAAAKTLAAQGFGTPAKTKAQTGANSSHPNNRMVRTVGDGWGRLGTVGDASKAPQGSPSIPKDVKRPGSNGDGRDLSVDVWSKLPDEGLGLVELSSVEPTEVRWLLQYRIPLGKFTLLAGEGDLGKTFMTLSIAAGVSTGGEAPGGEGERLPLGDVVILTAEDDLADTIRPRLDAMGADVTRIFALGTAKLPNGRQAPVTLRDIDRLEEVLRRRPETKLLLIDPVPSFLGHGIDDGKNADIRLILGPLAEFAGKYGVAVVGITHFNKAGGAKAANRVMGSVAYRNFARACWVVVPDPECESRRLFLPVKNNLSPVRNNGLAFSIVDGKVVWEAGGVSITANEVMASEGNAGADARMARAVAFLKDLLAGKEMPSEEVKARAKAAGFGKNLIWDAKDEAGVVARKKEFRGQWYWAIPAPDAPAESRDGDGIDWTKSPAPEVF